MTAIKASSTCRPPQPKPTKSRSRPLLYFAAPLDLFSTFQHRRALSIARKQFSGFRIVDPSRLRWNTTEWLAEWPRLIPQLDMLTVLPREDLTIGAGCFKEIAGARAAGIPVWVFSSEVQAFRLLQRMRRLNWWQRSMVDYARVHAVGDGRKRPPPYPGTVDYGTE